MDSTSARRSAQGCDLDEPTLDWGRKHNASKLTEGQLESLDLVRGNVLDPTDYAPDVTAAFNFSYFIFKERKTLLEYFRNVRKCLARNGIFVLDIYGGYEAQRLQEESTDHGDFEYIWDQAKYNPISGDYLCYIHFDFPDGTRRNRAFKYDWRLWSLPDVRDLLEGSRIQVVDRVLGRHGEGRQRQRRVSTVEEGRRLRGVGRVRGSRSGRRLGERRVIRVPRAPHGATQGFDGARRRGGGRRRSRPTRRFRGVSLPPLARATRSDGARPEREGGGENPYPAGARRTSRERKRCNRSLRSRELLYGLGVRRSSKNAYLNASSLR